MKSSANTYNENNLKLFDFWYNNSELARQITAATPSIYSIETHKKAFIDIAINRNVMRQYVAEFLNELEPGSLVVSAVNFDINATSQKVFDDGEGKIIKQIVKDDITTNETIGSINYTTGYVEFNALLLDVGTLRMTVTPTASNFYTDRNYVVYIDTINVDLLTTRKV